MVFCIKCGFEITVESAKFCPKCGTSAYSNIEPSTSSKSSMIPESDSKWWYLVPIIFGIIGGLIVYFAMRKNSPKIAKNCLKIGIIMFIVTFIGMIIITPFYGLTP